MCRCLAGPIINQSINQSITPSQHYGWVCPRRSCTFDPCMHAHESTSAGGGQGRPNCSAENHQRWSLLVAEPKAGRQPDTVHRGSKRQSGAPLRPTACNTVCQSSIMQDKTMWHLPGGVQSCRQPAQPRAPSWPDAVQPEILPSAHPKITASPHPQSSSSFPVSPQSHHPTQHTLQTTRVVPARGMPEPPASSSATRSELARRWACALSTSACSCRALASGLAASGGCSTACGADPDEIPP